MATDQKSAKGEFWEQQSAIFQKQLKGELTFEECWKLQTELLERNFKESSDVTKNVKTVKQNVVVVNVSDDSEGEENVNKIKENGLLNEENRMKEEDEIKEEDKVINQTNIKDRGNVKEEGKVKEGQMVKEVDNLKEEENVKELVANPLKNGPVNAAKSIEVLKRSNKSKSVFEPECEIKEDDSSLNKLLSTEKKHACNTCYFRAREYHTLKVHVEMNHVQLRFHCKICSWNTKERYPLKGHLKKEHGVGMEESDMQTMHECGICFFQGSKEQFEEHITVLHPTFKMILTRGISGISRKRSKHKICEYCQKDFTGTKMAAGRLRSHVELAHMKSGYKCVQCDFENSLKPAVYEHIGEKHLVLNLEKREKKLFKRRNTKYKCRVCLLLTDSHYEMLEHMEEKHEDDLKLVTIQRRGRRSFKDIDNGPRRFKCPKCDYKTNIVHNLKIHIEMHINSMFSCNICEETKKKRSQVVTHIKREHQMKLKLNYRGWCQKYVTCFCKDCNFLGSSRDYDDHLEDYHELPKGVRRGRHVKASAGEKNRTIYECGKCEKRYSTRLSLKQHIATKHLETVYSCDICDKSFRTIIDTKQHMASDHPRERDSVTTYCGECQTESANDLLYKHIMKVHRDLYTRVRGPKRSQKLPKNGIQATYNLLDMNVKGHCYFCDSSISKTETDSHILKFHMKVSYMCRNCGDEKPTRNSVYVHIKKAHTNEGVKFTEALDQCLLQVCGWCGYNGKDLEFAKHVKLHEKEILETTYTHKICNFCDFKHVSQRRLETHFAKIHDLKPFSCDECDFKSKTKQGLLDHYKMLHPEYKYKCKLCKFESSHFAALWRHHQDIHEQSRYHTCQICFARFKRNEFLQHHLKKVHQF